MRSLLAAAVCGVVVLCAGCQPVPAAASSSPRQGSVEIPVYHREAFGTKWAVVNGHCDTREVVLERDAGARAVDLDGDGCRDDGPVFDVYTGTTITPQKAQIDHVLSLKQAWVGGAWQWTPTQRVIFANDRGNLLAVTGSVNEAKGDLGPARWRPPAKSGLCPYELVYRATAERWNLPISVADDAALRDMAKSCPGAGQ